MADPIVLEVPTNPKEQVSIGTDQAEDIKEQVSIGTDQTDNVDDNVIGIGTEGSGFTKPV